MPEIKGILGPMPLVVLSFAGAFVIASLIDGGALLNEALLFFIYAVISGYTRQIYKDRIYFLRSANKLGKKTNDELLSEHERWWRRYYLFQAVLLIVVVIFLLYFASASYGLLFVYQEYRLTTQHNLVLAKRCVEKSWSEEDMEVCIKGFFHLSLNRESKE